MERIILIVITAFSVVIATAQPREQEKYVSNKELTTLIQQLQQTEIKVGMLESNQIKTNIVLRGQVASVDSLKDINIKLQQYCDSLQSQLSALSKKQSDDSALFSQNIQETQGSITATNHAISIRTLWVTAIAVLIVVLIVVVVFFITNRIKHSASSISDVRAAQDALRKAQLKMQEESIALDSKLADIISKQLEGKPSPSNGDIDHSLALKVADEIVRMELNLSRMDSSIKGHKQLSKAVERIKNNFSANGYEIVDMLGKPYNEGMKVVANFVVDESLKDGEQIISSITKPQVNYNGTMIQAAQITVSQNI